MFWRSKPDATSNRDAAPTEPSNAVKGSTDISASTPSKAMQNQSEVNDMHGTSDEPSFLQSVELMFAQAAKTMDMEPGLAEKIRVCNSTYTVRFGVRLRGEIHTFT
ncbi:MAG: hypothetical protein AAGB04_16050, partial [Pseudomonadota bacterium]